MPPRKKNPALPQFWDIMLDFETLNTTVDCAIVSVGAVRFNETEIDEANAFYRVITLDSNLDEGRTMSASTLKWWMQQSDAARAVFNDPSAVDLGVMLDEFREWGAKPHEWAHMRMWGNGADFDCAVMRHAYGRQGAPWMFYNTRCFRTLKSTEAAKAVPKPENKLAHNALADAYAQAQHLQALWAAGIGK